MNYFDLKCPYISSEKLHEFADDIFNRHWDKRKLPVEVEIIIGRLGLDVVPVPSLPKFEAWLSLDMKNIYVNASTYSDYRYENRLRFSLAHELGHFMLHRDIISKMNFDSAASYYNFHVNIPDSEYSWFEYQANEFAGRLLVPPGFLNEKVQEALDKIIKEGLTERFNMNPDEMLSAVSPSISRIFGVSDNVITIRIEREKFWPEKI